MQGGHTTTSHVIECDGCGKRYAWKPRLAGRKVKCRCGNLMTAPATPPPAPAPSRVAGPEDDDLYGLAPEPAAPQRPIPLTPVRGGGSAVPLSAAPAIDYQRADMSGDRMDLYFPDRVKDLYLPLGVIAGGTVVEFASSLLASRADLQGAARAVGMVGVEMIINTVLMLLAIFIVAKIRDISFGPLPTALLKLCAIAIGPGAAASLAGGLLGFIPLAGLLGWVIGFVLYFALLGALFDLDEGDTWWCVITIFVVKLFVAFVVISYLLFG